MWKKRESLTGLIIVIVKTSENVQILITGKSCFIGKLLIEILFRTMIIAQETLFSVSTDSFGLWSRPQELQTANKTIFCHFSMLLVPLGCKDLILIVLQLTLCFVCLFLKWSLTLVKAGMQWLQPLSPGFKSFSCLSLLSS
ncbi:hypothetical protein AAY473_000939 [Plecturocebus cupreus]